MADLSGVQLRLERAAEHLHTLQHGARMFMIGHKPYDWFIDNKLPNGEYIVRAKISRQPDARLGMLVADGVHNLRAALDMIAWELARAGPTPPPDDDIQTAFPICTDEDAWKSNRTQRMLKYLSQDAINLIYTFQPYNRPEAERRHLPMIQGIDNWAKHKAIPELLTFHLSNVRIISAYSMTSLIKFGAFNDGDEICRVRPMSDPPENLKAELMCHVGLSKEPPMFGLPLEALESAHGYIRDAILPTFDWFFRGFAEEFPDAVPPS